MKKNQLTADEEQMETELRKGEWLFVPNMKEEVSKLRSLARNDLKKNKKINIRISDWDYNKIKIRAVHEGLPYQTLVSSIIHKYVTGHLKSS